MGLKVYNTLSKKKEEFQVIEDKKVKMYVCGPTVYDFLHIGNFRGAIFFNLVRNWLEHKGYQVTYVYNYTDVDDKIIKKANDEGVESSVISERYIKEFETDFNNLKLKKHDYNPRVTEYMNDIIDIVGRLVDRGVAYVVDGEVFYQIDKFSNYGQLSGKNLEDLNAGERVEVDSRKRNPHDFVLWKPSKAGEPSWDSPWGAGRPGWHIECSAMIRSILGESIDIHGGGIDLIFPHHENEIAQGEGCCDSKYCRYWMHNNFINLKDEKMSKSLGNVVTARSFMQQYHPEILKYVMLSAHYRSMLNVSDDKIQQSISAIARVYSSLKSAHTVAQKEQAANAKVEADFEKLLKEMTQKIEKSLDDDFNTGEMLAAIFEVVRAFNAKNFEKKKNPNAVPTAKAFMQWVGEYGQVMSLFQEEPAQLLKALDGILIKERNLDVKEIEDLLVQRNKAREDKDWGKADEVRDRLNDMGVVILDGVDGTSWEVRK